MRPFQLVIACFVLVAVAACTTPKQPPLPTGNLVIGIAPFTQPKGISQMLAGYIAEDTASVTPELLSSLDILFAQELNKNAQNIFKDHSQVSASIKTLKSSSSQSKVALNYWIAVGEATKVDILVVPQILEWQERQGSSIGVTKPARVVLDFFVINVKDMTLISRSHTDEEQTALSENLLEAGKFFKRGGKWITGQELAQESMEKAIKELGL